MKIFCAWRRPDGRNVVIKDFFMEQSIQCVDIMFVLLLYFCSDLSDGDMWMCNKLMTYLKETERKNLLIQTRTEMTYHN